MTLIPADHPLRKSLNDEIHARPPESLGSRVCISFFALYGNNGPQAVSELCADFGIVAPDPGTSHFSADFGGFRMKWERHTEFSRFKFISETDSSAELFSRTTLGKVPSKWLATLPGQIIAANHLELVPSRALALDHKQLGSRYFGGNTIVGTRIGGGLASAFTDFQIHEDGFGRFVLVDEAMTQRQRGRMVQRLMEIDTYRMLSLLTFPVARSLMGNLNNFEQELNAVTEAMRGATPAQEPELLNRLTSLHSQAVNQQTATQFRFSAAKAYFELVNLRNKELRQDRIEGLQTFDEFLERRLGPAMRTCEAASLRLDALSERVSRATQLLSTRVDIVRENQNQALLESMDKRAMLQLRLQETVEGLSIAAITYYVVALVSYACDSVKELGLLPFNKAWVILASIPVVMLGVAYAIRRVRRSAGG